jgi:LPXTG-motif cell wall-anchored protein
MKKLIVAAMAACMPLWGLVAASPANAYPSIQVAILPIEKFGGETIVVNAKTDPPVNCTWRVRFSSNLAPYINASNPDTGSGSSFQKSYSTKAVPNRIDGAVTAECEYDETQTLGGGGGVGRFSTALAAVTTVSASNTVTLLPRGGSDDDDDDDDDRDDSDDNDDGGLPNTGGERLAWLAIGLLLVGGGATVIISSRRQKNSPTS